MWIYWVLFLWPAIAALVFGETRASAVAAKWPMWPLATVLTLVIGLRFEVSMDWSNYMEQLDVAAQLTWLEAAERGDPAYGTLNWIAANTGTGLWLVNLVCAIAFVSGLFVFCRKLPNPWLALTVAMPYMAIVMSMNYTRQSAAFGLVLWAMVALQDGRILRFVVFVVLAALFHKSAAVLIPLGVAVNVRGRILVLVWIGIISVVAYWVFIAELQEDLFEFYLAEQMASEGALIRVLMNAAAASVFLAKRDRFDMQPLEERFWTWMSIIALLFLPALWISPSSTVVDRVALYFMPVQLVAFSHLYIIVGSSGWRQFVTLSVAATYAIVMIVWFNYSPYAEAWLPYRFYPLEVM